MKLSDIEDAADVDADVGLGTIGLSYWLLC
jgi:hypothetical protein